MSDFRVYVGDEAVPMDGTAMELNVTHEVPAWGSMAFRPMTASASATFELTDAAWEAIAEDWSVGVRRDVRLTNSQPIHWSRWRRWINAVLRFAWWPLGPPALPESFEFSVDIPKMRIDRIAMADGCVTVDMATAHDEENLTTPDTPT